MEEYLKKESGGRSQVTKVIRIRKEAIEEERKKKLVDEIKFLKKIPEEWRTHFPEVTFSHIDGKQVYYEMTPYELPTIRRLLFSNELDSQTTLEWLDKILKFAFEMYNKEKLSVPKTYMQKMHTQRLAMRNDELISKTQVFKTLLKEEQLKINGRLYFNTPVIYKRMQEEDLIEKCRPPYCSKWAHSDMHFSNILLDLKGKNFVFLDPRGYRYCDYYYDFGKLLHSVNGKYEFIAENKFTLNDSTFKLKRIKAYQVCEEIKAGLLDILMKHSIEDRKITEMKTEFNEAIHFASLVPFILDLDGIEARARVAYYTGVILLNRWYEKYV